MSYRERLEEAYKNAIQTLRQVTAPSDGDLTMAANNIEEYVEHLLRAEDSLYLEIKYLEDDRYA